MINIFQVRIVKRNTTWIVDGESESEILFFRTYTNAKQYIDKIIIDAENEEEENYYTGYWKIKRKSGKIICIYLTYENFSDND